MPRYDNRNALILGAGRSGQAAARLIQARGGRASVVDAHWQTEVLAELSHEGFSCLTADRDHLPDGAYDLVVTSPSIPMTHPWITTARDRGLALISELELGAVYWRGESVAVIGHHPRTTICLDDINPLVVGIIVYHILTPYPIIGINMPQQHAMAGQPGIPAPLPAVLDDVIFVVITRHRHTIGHVALVQSRQE